jgi:molybdenum cofactor guanylyltransferase
MGGDKALVEVDGSPMVLRVATALADAGCDPVLAVGGDAAALAALGLSVLADRWPGEGPLGAIITALMRDSVPAVPVVAVACDLPWLDGATVRQLMPDVPAAPFDVALATTDRDELLCACWMPSALATLQLQFAAGERAVHRVLPALRVRRVAVADSVLHNVNTPDDLHPR